MVKEVMWYLDDNRFSGILKEMEDSVHDYARVKKAAKDSPKANTVRNKARQVLERHCVASGMRDEKHCFINIDAEFFNGEDIDDKAFNTFLKTVMGFYGYQRVLWTYMGTTGSFTLISKNAMKEQGLHYNDYLPQACQKPDESGPLVRRLGENVVPLYVHNDGTISQQYNPDKAHIRFDTTGDKSGFNWKSGYDPNGTVEKNGWHGSYTKDGVWVRVDETEDSHEPVNQPQKIELIKNSGMALLYDPGMNLIGPGLMYFTAADELYGSLAIDPEGTREEIQKHLKIMGATGITQIAVPRQTDEIKKAYQELLGETAVPDCVLVDPKEAVLVKQKRQEEASLQAEESFGIELERAITLGQKKTVHVKPGKGEDARLLGLTKEEVQSIAAYAPDRQAEFDAVLAAMYMHWSQFEHSGKSKPEMAELMYKHFEQPDGQSRGEDILTTQVTLDMLMDGTIPGIFVKQDPVDLTDIQIRKKYLTNLEKSKTLPKGGSTAMNTLLEKVPPETLEHVNIELNRILSQYRVIAASTGLPMSELIQAATDRASGVKNASLDRQVYYELSVSGLVKEAVRYNPVKTLPPAAKREPVEIVIGGRNGPALTDVGFSQQELETEYGYSSREAAKAAEFLDTIKISDVKGFNRTTLPALTEAVRGTTAAHSLRSNVIKLFDRNEHVRYNLRNSTGFSAYTESPRFTGNALSRNELLELTAYTAPAPGVSGVTSLRPVYTERGTVIPTERLNPPGLPEPVHLAGEVLYKQPEISALVAGAPDRLTQADTGHTPLQHYRDREVERLRKIEENYLKDKAALAREKAPALARSASHDVGTAQPAHETSTTRDDKRTRKLIQELMLEDLKRSW
jgi:hypothetical protein